MPWGRGGPWAGAGAWVDGQGPMEMARTTGRCGRLAQPVGATCLACGRRLGESSWPRVMLCPLGGGRVWPISQKCPQTLESWVRPLPWNLLKALRFGGRTRPKGTFVVPF